ncbi:MAG: hypothetical protein FD138_2507 [Planctomycetota bacterium]|nr:MAG: hypothetical protein FD138_2507 [Planctomycetota bacterium]
MPEPTAFSLAFATDSSKVSQWRGFLRKSRLDEAPPELVAVSDAIREFLSAPAAGQCGEPRFQHFHQIGRQWDNVTTPSLLIDGLNPDCRRLGFQIEVMRREAGKFASSESRGQPSLCETPTSAGRPAQQIKLQSTPISVAQKVATFQCNLTVFSPSQPLRTRQTTPMLRQRQNPVFLRKTRLFAVNPASRMKYPRPESNRRPTV